MWHWHSLNALNCSFDTISCGDISPKQEAAFASLLHYVFILRLVTWLMSILEAVQFATLCHASFPATLLALTLCDIAKDHTECKLLLSICSRKWSHPLLLGNCSHCWLQLNIKCALKSFYFHEVLTFEILPTYSLSNTDIISSFLSPFTYKNNVSVSIFRTGMFVPSLNIIIIPALSWSGN